MVVINLSSNEEFIQFNDYLDTIGLKYKVLEQKLIFFSIGMVTFEITTSLEKSSNGRFLWPNGKTENSNWAAGQPYLISGNCAALHEMSFKVVNCEARHNLICKQRKTNKYCRIKQNY